MVYEADLHLKEFVISDRENRHWSEEYSWATRYKHNDLFRPGDDWQLNAFVGRNGGPYELDDYADGYFLSGRRLVDSLLENPTFLDVIIYPLVFTYRHAIELVLKYLAEAKHRSSGMKKPIRGSRTAWSTTGCG